MTGSAPISAELKAFVEAYLDLHLMEPTARPRPGLFTSTARCDAHR